jgi:biotin synthase-related radical SAM superfamily protein
MSYNNDMKLISKMSEQLSAIPQVAHTKQANPAAEKYRLEQARQLLISLGYVELADGTFEAPESIVSPVDAEKQ